MTPLPLTPEQVRALQESGSVETWDEVEPQPGRDCAGFFVYDSYASGHCSNAQFRCGEPSHGEIPHPIGTSAWVQEKWIKCTGCYGQPGLIYKAGCDHVPAHRWKAARLMNREASRFTVTSTAVRIERREGVWGFVTRWERA